MNGSNIEQGSNSTPIGDSSYFISTRVQEVGDKVYNFTITGRFNSVESVEDSARNLAFLLERYTGISGATYQFYEIGPREVSMESIGC